MGSNNDRFLAQPAYWIDFADDHGKSIASQHDCADVPGNVSRYVYITETGINSPVQHATSAKMQQHFRTCGRAYRIDFAGGYRSSLIDSGSSVRHQAIDELPQVSLPTDKRHVTG